MENDCVTDVEDTKNITSPIKAIRAKCLDCCCGSFNEVKLCTAESCPLYAFRFGKNPYRKKKELTEEQKNALIEGLRKSREKGVDNENS